MKQVVCSRIHSDASRAAECIEAKSPTCPEAGVIVAVRVRPINPADLLLLTGRHVFVTPPNAPVGIEGAGEVIEVGASSRHRRGDLVAIPFGGTWCERMALGDEDVIDIPKGFDLEQAAMLNVNPMTAAGLLEGVQAGTTILVNAPKSAIAQLILALCRKRGIHAIAIARDDSSQAALRAQGVGSIVVDGERLAERVQAVAGSPVLFALDAVAGEASGRLFDALAEGGKLVVYGLLSEDKVHVPAASLVFRNVVVVGYSRLRAFRALATERREALVAEVLSLVADGTLKTTVAARYALDDVKAALTHQQRQDRVGKILLVS
jgi:mitochondrial enoyl-[acyl-carrier protein] reductase / trans-2-enoyl-CoA reductase